MILFACKTPLFTFIFLEIAFLILIVFKTPLRERVMLGVDRLNQGRGAVLAYIVTGTLFAGLMLTVYTMRKIHKRGIQDAVVNPTDEVLMFTHLLQATIMGSSLFLGLMIDRLHHCMRELPILRKSLEDLRIKNQDLERINMEMIEVLEEEKTKVRGKLKQLESQLEGRTKDLSTTKVNVVALRKQSEGLIKEYGRLREENQKLRYQLRNWDFRLSQKGSKKNT